MNYCPFCSKPVKYTLPQDAQLINDKRCPHCGTSFPNAKDMKDKKSLSHSSHGANAKDKEEDVDAFKKAHLSE